MCTCRLLADAPDVLGVTVTVGRYQAHHQSLHMLLVGIGMSCLQSVSHMVSRVSVVSETLQKYVLPHLAAILCTSLAVPAATPKVQMMCTHTFKCIQLAHWMPSPSSQSYSRLCNPISTASFAAAHSRNPPQKEQVQHFFIVPLNTYTSSILDRNHVCLHSQHFAYVLRQTFLQE